MHAGSRTQSWTVLVGLAVAVCSWGNGVASTADHKKFKELQVEFRSGPEVTRACLSCHTEAARQIMKTKHWTWKALNPKDDQELGKSRLFNNFCISIVSNYRYCTSCHVGYGWENAQFDFSSEENVDCLVCHDTTGTYRKPPGLAGHPVYREMEFPPGSGEIMRPVDLQKIAQRVGKTSRYTCGACHFYAGGGDGVKHGDLDSSLGAPDEEIDVHMDVLGNDFSCGTCHMTLGHKVPGSRYAPVAKDRGGRHIRGKMDSSNPGTCEACHGNRPHTLDGVADLEPPPGFTRVALAAMINNHTETLACQTCHIPTVARGGVPTKMVWDWSLSGRMGPEGKPYFEKDEHGHVVYDTRKGAFEYRENVVPSYVWFNGEVDYTLLGDKVDKKDGVLTINRFGGDPGDGRSRIWPVKIFRGVQPYDPLNKILVVPHTFGQDENAYFEHYEWKKSIAAAMSEIGLPFSGQIDFIETRTFFILTHMVAPKEESLDCRECHDWRGSLAFGRLKDVPGLKRISSLDLRETDQTQ